MTSARRSLDAVRFLAAALVASVMCLTAASADDMLTVRYQSVDDSRPREGRLTALTTEGAAITDAGGERRDIARTDLWWIEPLGEAPSQPPREQAIVLLTNRDRLRCDAITLQEGALSLQRGDEAAVAVPLEFVTGIVLPGPRQQAFERLLLRTGFEADALLLENNDRLAGEVQSIDAEACRILSGGAEQSVPLEQTAAIAFQSDLSVPVPLPPQHAALVLHDGSLLTATRIETGEGAFRISLAAEANLVLPRERVARIDFHGSRALSLVDLPAPEFSFTPYLDRTARWEQNRNCDAGLLRLGDSLFARGIGTAPRTSLTWQVPAGAKTFHCAAGIDAAADELANADLAVLVDGKEGFRAETVNLATGQLEIGPIDVSGSSTLTLAVDFGAAGDVSDVVNWTRPVFLK